MSLILEALKKSERQRQIGHAPTLATPMMTRRRRRSPLPWLVGAIVIAAGAGWWLSRDRVVETPAAAPAQSAPAAAKSARPDAPMTVTPPPRKPGAGAAARGARSAATPEAKVAEVERAVAAAAPPVPADTPDAAAATPAPAKSTSAAAKPGQAGAGERNAKASPTAGGAPLPRTSPTPTGPVAAPPAPPPAAAPPPAPVPVATAEPSSSAGLPLLWELPYDRRKDIPKLALSLQVYSADPASRFAIVNDERHKEGDTIADGLVLREITPEGLVLEFQGDRFLYPRGGR